MADQDPKPDKRDSDDNRRDDQNQTPGGQKPPSMMSRGAFMWIMIVALGITFLLLMFSVPNQAREISWEEFKSLAEAQQFEEPVVIHNTKIVGKVRPDAPGVTGEADTRMRQTTITPDTKAYRLHVLSQELGQDTKEQVDNNILLDILINWAPFFIILLLVYFILIRPMRAGGGGGGMLGGFGRSRHKVMTKEHSTVRLTDVAGIDEAKDEVTEVIEFLKNPKKFQRLGGRVPRGVLLIGSPGCGKTLLAKAVAGEADVPFFSISGSDFVEMFVGVGASRVRDLFKQAKDSSPCIIFLDEIDAVGRRRGSGFSSGGHDEREQTLNAILVEMDGFESSDQIIVIAATNRADVLDPALIRPGRFDRQIQVPLPDVAGRLEILKVHAERIKTAEHVDLEKIARGTPMFSGADLSAIINEAAIAATMQGKDFVEHADLEEARDKVRWGRSRKSARLEEDEKRVIAYHEAGHAVVMHYDPDAEPLHKVTIIPRGPSLGSTYMLPEKDKHILSKKQLLGHMRVAFGGRIAEEMFTGDQYNGTAGDIRQVSEIAQAMITEYGMSQRLGFRLYGHDEGKNPWEQPDRLYSDDTAKTIDEEVKSLIDKTYNEAKTLIETHRDQTEALAEALIKYETLNAEEVQKVFDGQPLARKSVSDVIKAEQQRDDTKESASAKPSEPDMPHGGMPSPA
ncbi:ATP-dependent zinc metalloprotease FtsH [Mucisphaera calidilacus]|uniref:ATP-dependent zinc metalloprotease FtsH n=1 Tax=Mucisphaera calidilacus TaxID=2527982 RepID=A0A518BUM7_9BACT|nr:ATP-dependent zinc metalloprotease FtsH [Mucisphaera calidilacus]QDU70695.1 ATP-dependent zinc metalloprotease FtsH [Mucisphaera calidilacus]